MALSLLRFSDLAAERNFYYFQSRCFVHESLRPYRSPTPVYAGGHSVNWRTAIFPCLLNESSFDHTVSHIDHSLISWSRCYAQDASHLCKIIHQPYSTEQHSARYGG